MERMLGCDRNTFMNAPSSDTVVARTENAPCENVAAETCGVVWQIAKNVQVNAMRVWDIIHLE